MWCHNISGYWLSLRIIGVESNMMAFNGLLCFTLTTAAVANVNNKDKISGKRKFAFLANLSLLVVVQTFFYGLFCCSTKWPLSHHQGFSLYVLWFVKGLIEWPLDEEGRNEPHPQHLSCPADSIASQFCS